MWRDKSLLLFGVAIALLAFVMRVLDYHYVVYDLPLDMYIAATAVLFLAFGWWLSKRIAPSVELKPEGDESTDLEATEIENEPVTNPTERMRQLGLTTREAEVLLLMAGGLSNQEIADKLFVSLNTIKTHSSNLFLKLDVKRRTQAIQKAREMELF